VDFTLSPEQHLLRDSARAMLARECPTSLVRAHLDDAAAAADALWKHLREFTALGVGPLTDLCLFLEETGAVLAPGPFFATAALYAPLTGDTEHTGTVALAGPDGVWAANASPTRTFVVEADRVDVIAVVDTAGYTVVRPPVTLRAVETLDTTRRVFDLDVDLGTAGAAQPVAADALRDWLARASIALGAEMVGAARGVLAMTVEYARQRVQFDRPIGSFQAIQHKLADMALAWERAWSAVYYAAMCVDAADPDRHRAAHVAKAAAGEAARRAAKDGIQIHGGIGYTWEHDLHLFIRRLYASEYLLGTTAWHHDRLAELLFS
jgi:alkylation response protein AidB-like acyl-CoA dehydrogenase